MAEQPGIYVTADDPWVVTSDEDVIVVYNVRRNLNTETAVRAIAVTLHVEIDYGPLFILIDQARGAVYSFHRSLIDTAFLEPDGG